MTRLPIISGVIFFISVTIMTFGEFYWSAEIGSTFKYLLPVFVGSGIVFNFFLIKYLYTKEYKLAFFGSIVYLLIWTVTQLYITFAVLELYEYNEPIHWKIHYFKIASTFLFGTLLLLTFKHGLPMILKIFGITLFIMNLCIGIDFIFDLKLGQYVHILDPIPVILLFIFYWKNFTKPSSINPEVLDN